MDRIGNFIAALFGDGFKALGVFSWLLSGAFTIGKWLGVLSKLQDVSYAWALLPITVWLFVAYVRRWLAFEDQVNAPRPNALTLSTLGIHDVAEFLLNDSRWGWEKRLQLTFKRFVKDHVTLEMRRAGKSHEVRYIGTEPNSAEAKEIDRAYWQYATIDDSRIWDERTKFFTTTAFFGTQLNSNIPHLRHYQYGSAPSVDIFRTWPRASRIYRIYVTFLIWTRCKWFGLREPPNSPFSTVSKAFGQDENEGEDLFEWKHPFAAALAWGNSQLLSEREVRQKKFSELFDAWITASAKQKDFMEAYPFGPGAVPQEEWDKYLEIRTVAEDRKAVDVAKAALDEVMEVLENVVRKNLMEGVLIAQGHLVPIGATPQTEIEPSAWRSLSLNCKTAEASRYGTEEVTWSGIQVRRAK